jgi:hypothetical protein
MAVICLTVLLPHLRAGDGYLLLPNHVTVFKLNINTGLCDRVGVSLYSCMENTTGLNDHALHICLEVLNGGRGFQDLIVDGRIILIRNSE